MAGNSPIERALRLAAVTGLKATFGPALISAAQRRPEHKKLAMAALGEMVIDVLPYMPSRSSLPLLLPRAMAGYWTAQKSLEADGIDDPGAAAMGAAVAAGVAIAAPMIRKILSTVLRVPDAVLGVAEDYVALKVGAEAAGLSMHDLTSLATEALTGMTDSVGPIIEDVRYRLQLA
jgi:hypothetical protein